MSDEGLAGARIDAESHVTIDVEFNQPAYSFAVASSIAPSPSRTISVPGAVAMITCRPTSTAQKTAASTDERFCPAETRRVFRRLRAPEVSERSNNAFTVTAAGTTAETAAAVRSVGRPIARQRDLIAQILRGSDWTRSRWNFSSRLRRHTLVEHIMFRIYEWNFSSTVDVVIGALLVCTILVRQLR